MKKENEIVRIELTPEQKQGTRPLLRSSRLALSRLPHGPNATVREARPRTFERGFDLGGMMGIIIEDTDAVRFAAQLEAATCTREFAQRLSYTIPWQA